MAESCIFVYLRRVPIDVIRNASNFGWDLQELICLRQAFQFSTLLPIPETGKMWLVTLISSLIERMNYAIESTKPARLPSIQSPPYFQQ